MKSQEDNNELIYGGYSAGVCVLSPSLKGLDIIDDPNLSIEGYKDDVVWEGVGLIDFSFAPHFESNHPASAGVAKEVDYYKARNIKFKALHDGDIIIKKT